MVRTSETSPLTEPSAVGAIRMETFLLVFSDLYAFDCAVGRLSHISNASAYARVDRLLKYEAAAANHIYIFFYIHQKRALAISESLVRKSSTIDSTRYGVRGTCF